MTRPNGSWVLLYITLIQIFGLYTLLIGLVGEKKSDKEVTPIPRRIYNELFPSDDNNEPGTYTFPKEMAQTVYSTFQDTFQSNVRYKGSVTQIVLLVVDAMRVDFLSKNKMPFVSSLLDESFGCVYVSRVKAPTVTLPRIKAIVTGDVSTYWDIIQNFKSQKITQDNILWHARQDFKKRIVFYGDDTWLKLFPKEFDRFEGVSSFFVSDFNQVDLNVTRRLDEEIKTWKPWDMLILHYLGLDHIGHVHGPNSGLIPPKLLEMDGVVKKIYEFISSNGPHSMIILCGDHGMANVGGHGGNSYPEVTTPLIFLSTRELTKCYNKDWRRLRDIPTVEQTDMAPTISALWGMMFPSQSAGKIIPNLLSYLPNSRQLFALYYNALHLRKFIKPDDKSLQKEYSQVVGRHILYVNNKSSDSRFASREESDLIESYTNLLRLLSESASGTVGTQNLALFGTGTALCIQAILIAFTTWKYQFQLWDLLLIPAIGLLVYFTESPGANTLLFLNAYLVSFKFGIKLPEMDNETLLNYFNYLIVPIFYFSSSYVEEEHLMRYYLWATLLFSLSILQTPPAEPRHTYASSAAIPDPHEHPIVPIPIPKSNRPAKVLTALVLHRVAISWNQTGQKWTDLNDLVDLLKGYNLLVFVVPVSLCFLYRLRFDRCHFFHAFTVLIIWLIKVDTGIVRYLSFNFFENEPQFAYILIALDFCISLKLEYSLKTSVLNFWILFSLLIHRHENLPLISIILHQVRIVSKIFQEFLPIKDSSNWSKRQICILWFSFAAFYYQGNSNNIASIDVNAGYTGLSSYHEALVGILIFCNTFSAPMLIFLAFIEEKSYEDWLGHYRREKYVTLSFLNSLTKTNSTTIGIYCLVLWIFRHHLFIWTVFTPKLLYVISFSSFYAIIILLYGIFQEIRAITNMWPATVAN